MIVYVCIGNSDDKLEQYEWSLFVMEAKSLFSGVKKHGEWFSAPDSRYQNACWCIEIQPNEEEFIQKVLRSMCRDYEQNSISWAEVPNTKFIGPIGA